MTITMTEPCVFCTDPPSGPPLGEGHVAVRFGGARFTVLLDGTDVSHWCTEAFAGDPGWVIVFPDDPDGRKGFVCPHPYGLRDHPYAIKRHGNVSIKAKA